MDLFFNEALKEAKKKTSARYKEITEISNSQTHFKE